jgi:CRISPR/Cas system-associated endonuclease Cas1
LHCIHVRTIPDVALTSLSPQALHELLQKDVSIMSTTGNLIFYVRFQITSIQIRCRSRCWDKLAAP